jgi:hypothetical protein
MNITGYGKNQWPGGSGGQIYLASGSFMNTLENSALFNHPEVFSPLLAKGD